MRFACNVGNAGAEIQFLLLCCVQCNGVIIIVTELRLLYTVFLVYTDMICIESFLIAKLLLKIK